VVPQCRPGSPSNPAGREGTGRRTLGTSRERSPPSPVRSGYQDWPTLQGTDQAARGRLGLQDRNDQNSPFRAAEGAPPGFTALATGPTLNVRPEWLSNPRGTAQRTPGENFGHGPHDAHAGQLGAPRPRGLDASREDNNLALRKEWKPAPTRLRFEEDEWGDSPKRQAPAKLEGLANFPTHPRLLQEAGLRQW
jgi:hypothetical protein